jgi:hypothetical protein
MKAVEKKCERGARKSASIFAPKTSKKEKIENKQKEKKVSFQFNFFLDKNERKKKKLKKQFDRICNVFKRNCVLSYLP